MPGFRSEGISGYVGKRTMKRPFGRRRGFKRRRKFNRRIVNIMNKNNRVKSVYSAISPQQCVAAAGTVGTQQIANIALMNTGADVVGIFGQINANTPAVGTNTVSRFQVDAYILQIAMKNQDQCNCIADLYEITPRTDNTTDPAVEWGNLQGLITGAANDHLKWGWTPFQNPLICQNYKILRKVRYLLAPGAVEIVEIRDRKRRYIELSRFYTLAGAPPSGSMMLRGVSKAWVVIVRGEPTNDSTTKTSVNSSSYKMDFVVREDYHYTYDVSEMKPIVKTNTVTGAITQENMTLIDTGACNINPAQS